MTAIKITLIFALLLTCIGIVNGQDAPAARLTDELEVLPCDDILGRTDNFMIEIQKVPNSIGYAVIYPQKGQIKEATDRQVWIEGNVAFRKFFKDRLIVIRGEERDKAQIQFWLVPEGSAKPDIKEQKWSHFTPGLNKAFVFSSTSDYIQCPGNYFQTYVDFLIDNPGTRGHVVIFNKTGRYDNAEAESWIKDFASEGIDHTRLRIFFAKRKLALPEFEFWINPVRSKR